MNPHISFAILTGITCGLPLCFITCFRWRARLKYRLRTFGKSAIAKVEKRHTHISFDELNEEHTTYSYTCSFKKIITEQGLRYILQKMASAFNVHLPTDIIDLCLEYSANSFIIYYPIMIKGVPASKSVCAGQTFNVRYDPKYPKCNNVYCESKGLIWHLLIWSALILFIVSVIPIEIGYAISYAEREDKGDGVFQMIWITCVSMICVLLIVVCAIYIIMSHFALNSSRKKLQCIKINDIDPKSNNTRSLTDLILNNSSKDRRQRELSVRRQERERMRDRLRKKRERRNNDDDESNINTFDLNNGRVKSVSKKSKKNDKKSKSSKDRKYRQLIIVRRQEIETRIDQIDREERERRIYPRNYFDKFLEDREERGYNSNDADYGGSDESNASLQLLTQKTDKEYEIYL